MLGALASKLNVDIPFILSTLACLGTGTVSLASVKEPHKEGGGGREDGTYGDRVMNQGNNISKNRPNVFSIIAMKISRIFQVLKSA